MATNRQIELGKRLKKARTDAGLRQEQVAEAIGTHAVTVSKYERGVHDPNTELLREMASLYGVSVDWVLNGDSGEEEDINDPSLSLFFRGEWDEFTEAEKEFVREAIRDASAYLKKRNEMKGRIDDRS